MKKILALLLALLVAATMMVACGDDAKDETAPANAPAEETPAPEAPAEETPEVPEAPAEETPEVPEAPVAVEGEDAEEEETVEDAIVERVPVEEETPAVEEETPVAPEAPEVGVPEVEVPEAEAHPDAVAVAEMLNAEIGEEEEEGRMYATAEGNSVVVVMEIKTTFIEQMLDEAGISIDELTAMFASEFESSPFEDEEMASQYPGVEAFEVIIKTTDGEVLYTQTFSKYDVPATEEAAEEEYVDDFYYDDEDGYYEEEYVEEEPVEEEYTGEDIGFETMTIDEFLELANSEAYGGESFSADGTVLVYSYTYTEEEAEDEGLTGVSADEAAAQFEEMFGDDTMDEMLALYQMVVPELTGMELYVFSPEGIVWYHAAV